MNIYEYIEEKSKSVVAHLQRVFFMARRGKENQAPLELDIAEFGTRSGEYYLAKLVRKPSGVFEEDNTRPWLEGGLEPLQQACKFVNESSDTYEKFSIRKTSSITTPQDSYETVATLIYDKGTQTVTSYLGVSSEWRNSDFFKACIELFEKLYYSVDDEGDQRVISCIKGNICEVLEDNELLTNRGIIPYWEYDPEVDLFVSDTFLKLDEYVSRSVLHSLTKLPQLRLNTTNLSAELKDEIEECPSLEDSSQSCSYAQLRNVWGDLYIQSENVFLPLLTSVQGNMWFVGANLIATKLENVEGELDLELTYYGDLVSLSSVKKTLSIATTDEAEDVNLPALEYIGGHCFIHGSIILPKISYIAGDLVIWYFQRVYIPQLPPERQFTVNCGGAMDFESQNSETESILHVEGRIRFIV